jgi:cytochrome c-type biogenesis protein CcmH
MMPFVLYAVLLGLAAAALLTRPLWWRRAAAEAARPSLVWSAGLSIFVLALAAGGYAGIGTPEWFEVQATAQSAAAAAQPAQAQGMAQVSALVDQLAERLKSRPDDARGWQMLARSYAALERHAEAVDAYKTAVRLQPDDAALLADYAFAAAMVNQRSFDGEPAALVERALALDPNHPKALALAGTMAFERKDYPAAVRHWEQLAKVEPGDSPFAQQINAGIAQARQLGGMPPAPASRVAPAAPAAPGTATAPTAGAAPARITGTVQLAPALRARVSPTDTLFIFARATEGPRAPLAILRKQVKDLPLQFTLDDSLAMSPAMKLSNVPQAIVGARISRSGNAMPQAGDLQALSAPVPVTTTGLVLTIDTPIPGSP